MRILALLLIALPLWAADPVADIKQLNQPSYQLNPVCRAGRDCTLTGAGSTGDTSLTYLWEPQSGVDVFLSADDTVQVTATCAQFGQFTMRLTVTDEAMVSDPVDVDIGCVAVDENDIVVYPTLAGNRPDALDLLLGHRLKFGEAPWPAIDKLYVSMADYYGGAQASIPTRYGDHWNDIQSSTVRVENGSPTVTCDDGGCAFQTAVCGGDANVGVNGRIAIILDDGSKRQLNPVDTNGCPSDTTLTLQSNYDGATDSGLSWAPYGDPGMASGGNLANWVNGSDNNNYYSNIQAFYGLYYQTGLTKYRDYARVLAALWWDMPAIDEGRCYANGFSNCVGPKELDLAGLFLWTLESGTDNWDGLTILCEGNSSNPSNDESDIREDGYRLAGASDCAMLHPDSGVRASRTANIATALNTSTGRWGSTQVPSGIGQGMYLNTFFPGDNGAGDSVSVENGSPTVTYNSGGCGACGDTENWVGIRTSGQAAGDITVAYALGSYSAPTLTLESNYQGTTGSGRLIQVGNIVGKGVQPWQTQPGIGLALAHEVGDSQAITQLDAFAEGTNTIGFNANAQGFYFVRVAPQCETGDAGLESGPDIDGTRCGGGAAPLDSTEIIDRKFFALEVYRFYGLAIRYLRGVDDSLVADLITNGDKLMAAAFASFDDLGGPGTNDGIEIAELEDAYDGTITKPKDFGFLFGWSTPYVFLAERIGGQAPENLRQYRVPFDLSSVADSVDVSVTLTQPKGSNTDTAVCSTSPCLLTGDYRQGAHLATVVYRDNMGQTLDTQQFMVEQTTGYTINFNSSIGFDVSLP